MVIINSTILSGAGAIPSLTSLLPDIRKMLLVTDRNIAQLDGVQQIRALLEKHCPQVNVIDNVPAEPTHHDVRQLMDAPGDASFDVVVGIGGGSVLDVAKLLSVLCHPQSPGLDALLAGEKPTQRVQSWLIPTTAGTGSEATPNAILAIPEQSTKVGIISQVLLPDYVALFPELTTSMPAHIAASTGIDALCHLLECFTATVANPVSDNPCGHASRSCALLPVRWQISSAAWRRECHLAGAVHGVCSPLGGREICPGLGLHSRCGNRPERGRKISCPGDLVTGISQSTQATQQSRGSRRTARGYCLSERGGTEREAPYEQCAVPA